MSNQSILHTPNFNILFFSSTWNYTENTGPCHQLQEDLKTTSTNIPENCELYVENDYYYDSSDTELPLICCDPSDRSICDFSDYEYDDEAVLFSVSVSQRATFCRNGCIYSKWKGECVGKSRGKKDC